MIDLRVNNIFWREMESRSKAATRLGCGYFDNGLFDIEDEALAKKILRSHDTSAELKEEACGYLDGDVDTLRLTYIR